MYASGRLKGGTGRIVSGLFIRAKSFTKILIPSRFSKLIRFTGSLLQCCRGRECEYSGGFVIFVSYERKTAMKVGTYIMKGLLRALSALPLGFHRACGRFISWLLKDVVRYRRDVVMANLARSFPERKYDELERIADRFYRHLGNIAAEAVWFGGCRNPERLRKKRLVGYSNMEVFEKAYSGSGGVVVLNSHFGNWELLGGCLCYDYRPGARRPEGLEPDDVLFVYKPLKNAMWDEIVGENRCAPVLRLGYKGYVSTDRVLRHVLENKDRKLVINMLSDQCPYKGSAAVDTVAFLHQETRTMFGGASLACKFGWSVLYSCLFPVDGGRYEWRFTEICRDASGLTVHEIMQKYYDLLQADIEACPWCYLWSHKRWKR